MTRAPIGSPPVVILVEADMAVTHAIEFAFGLEGLCIRSYPNGAATLASNQLRRAGCLVLDDQLPDMNGLDLLGQLRANGVLTPAILIATNPKAALRERAAIAGVQIIEKPLLNDGLLDAVRQALDSRSFQPPGASAPVRRDCGPASLS